VHTGVDFTLRLPDPARRPRAAQEPKLPSPRIDPQEVADAILDAAANPRRDVKVGLLSKIHTTVAKLVPPLADKAAAKQVDRQHYDEATRDAGGALYKPGGTGQVHGQPPIPASA
jgi:short-subunit dehydrogenase